jgi:hypothetical protein
MSLFTESNPKLEKGEDLGYLSFGLHFAPATISGYQVCASASSGCTIACLYTSGKGGMTYVQNARIAKTRRFFEAREIFLNDMVKDMYAALRRADRLKMAPAFRLNLTSDIRWETVEVQGTRNVMDIFDGVQFLLTITLRSAVARATTTRCRICSTLVATLPLCSIRRRTNRCPPCIVVER